MIRNDYGSDRADSLRAEFARRFGAKVDRGGPIHPELGTPCWIWRGALRAGYGVVGIRSPRHTTAPAHRVAWEIAHGHTPGDREVMHRCDTPACVNPGHLELGTHADNIADRDRKGRTARGPRLSPDAVRAIRVRRAAGASLETLAEAFGVTPQTIDNAASGRTWRHVA